MMSRIKCLILATVEHLGMFQLPLSASRPWIGEAFYMVSTPIREMTKNSPIPPPTCPPELVFAFYQIELSEDSRILRFFQILPVTSIHWLPRVAPWALALGGHSQLCGNPGPHQGLLTLMLRAPIPFMGHQRQTNLPLFDPYAWYALTRDKTLIAEGWLVFEAP